MQIPLGDKADSVDGNRIDDKEMMMVDGDEVVGDVGPTPKASPLTVQPTLGGLAPMLKRIRPLGSLVRNLKDMVPVFTASHFGKICTKR